MAEESGRSYASPPCLAQELDPAWFEARTFFDDPAFFEADGTYAEVSADTESLTSEPVSTRSSDGATTEPG